MERMQPTASPLPCAPFLVVCACGVQLVPQIGMLLVPLSYGVFSNVAPVSDDDRQAFGMAQTSSSKQKRQGMAFPSLPGVHRR